MFFKWQFFLLKVVRVVASYFECPVGMSVVFDKATAFKNELTGSTTNKIVCKASSHEIAGPKKKHVDCKCLSRSLLKVVYWAGVACRLSPTVV